MTAILLLGFLLGMRHALEADHVAAVATLATRGCSRREALTQGAAWGLGHTTTLFLACSLVLFLDAVVPQQLADLLEGLVGLMLLLLGADLFRRLLRDRVHFHAHRHENGLVHFHAHSHKADPRGHDSDHDHEHRASFPARALCVGLMHGLAGSAALILLALGSVSQPLTGLLYVALFGLGSIIGMAVLSLAISVPLTGTRRITWLHNGLQATVALATLGVGGHLLVASYRALAVAWAPGLHLY